MTLPVLIYITGVDCYSQRLQFDIYNIDRSVRSVIGDISLLQQYIQEIEKYRRLADEVEEFRTTVVNLEQQIINIQRQIQEREAKITDLRENKTEKLLQAQTNSNHIIQESRAKLEATNNKHQVPEYNENIIKAMATETKIKILVGSLIGIGIGLYFSLGSQGEVGKVTGGVVAGIGGLVALSVAPKKSVSAEEKFKHLGLKAEAQRVKDIRENAEQRNQAAIKAANAELSQISGIISKQISEFKGEIVNLSQEFYILQREYKLAVEYLQVALAYHEFIRQSGSEIVFGEGKQINMLNKLIYSIQNPNQINEQDVVAGAVVAGVIGLAAIGLYNLLKD